jgi:transcription elongation factor Elf1
MKNFWIKFKCFFGFHKPKSTFSVDSVTNKTTSNCKHCNKDFELRITNL